MISSAFPPYFHKILGFPPPPAARTQGDDDDDDENSRVPPPLGGERVRPRLAPVLLLLQFVVVEVSLTWSSAVIRGVHCSPIALQKTQDRPLATELPGVVGCTTEDTTPHT